MAKVLDKSEDKIQQICNQIKIETLEPARAEAGRIIDEAHQKAKGIVAEAERQAASVLQQAHEAMRKERSVFETSLRQATAQCFEGLKQTIQSALFNDQIQTIIEQAAATPQVVAQLIKALVEAIEREGTSANFEVIIPNKVPAKEVNALLGGEILSKLQGGSVKVGGFAAGAQIKLLDRKLTLDMSDEMLKELLSHYLREDFRELLFQS